MIKFLKYLKGPAVICAIIAPLAMMLEVSMDLLQPVFLSNIIDIGIANGDLHYVLTVGLKMIIVAIIGAIGGITGSIAVGVATFLYYVMTTEYPKSSAMSYITYGYYHKDSAITGYIGDYGAAVTKLLSFFYAEADYEEYICSETNYEVWIRY